MKLSTLKTLPAVILMTGFVGFFFAYVDFHLDYIRVLPFPAANVFLVLLVALNSGTMLLAAASQTSRQRVESMYASQITVIAPLVGIVLFSFVSSFVSTANADVGPRYVMYPAYDAVIILLAMLLPYRVHHRDRFRLYLFGALVVLAGSVFVNAVRPGTFSFVNTRAAGFPTNPNTAAFVLVALCCSILDFGQIRLLSVMAILLTSVGVLATLSRGGLIMLAFLLVFYLYGIARRKRGRLRLLGTLAGVACLGGLIALGSSQLMQRASIFALPSQTREGMLTGRESLVPQDEARVRLLNESLGVVRESPILGFGSGYTYTMGEGPHNIYLQQWINNGIAGLGCYVWLLIAAVHLFWRRRNYAGLAFMGVVALEGMFSHNLLEERAFLVGFGVLLTLSYFEASEADRVPGALLGRRSRRSVGSPVPVTQTVDREPRPISARRF